MKGNFVQIIAILIFVWKALLTNAQYIQSISHCQEKEYDNIVTGCSVCEDLQCQRCIYQACLECSKGFDYELNKCLGTNELCSSGYFLNSESKICEKCQIPGCVECSSLEICATCKAGFQLTSNYQCVIQALVDNSSSSQYKDMKQIVDDNDVTLKYYCPPLYEVGKDERTCQKLQYCSNGIQSDEYYLKYPIKQIIVLNISQLLAISQKQITLINPQNQKLERIILNLQSSAESQEEEQDELIHRIVQLQNILNVFTNQRILAYNAQNLRLISSIDFIQGNYLIDKVRRFDFNLNLKQIALINLDSSNQLYYLTIITLQFNQVEGVIDPDSYLIQKIQSHNFNLLQTELVSITLFIQQDLVFITSKEECYYIIISKLISASTQAQINNLSDGEINSNSYLMSSNLMQEIAIEEDQIMIDEDQHKLFILRKVANINYLFSIMANLNQMTLSISSKQFQTGEMIYYSLHNQIQNLQDKFGKYILLHIVTKINNENSGKQYMEIESLQNQYKQMYTFEQSTTLNQQITQVQLLANKINGQLILLASSDQYLYLFTVDLANKVIKQNLDMKVDRLFTFDFYQIMSNSQQDINFPENSFFDIYVPQYSILNTIRISGKQTRVLKTSQLLFEGSDDLFNLPFYYQDYIATQQFIEYDNINNHLYLFDYVPDIQAITIQMVEIDTNKYVSSFILYLDTKCIGYCFSKVFINQKSNVLILILENYIYRLNMQTFQVLSSSPHQGILDINYPYLTLYLQKQQNELDYSLIQIIKFDDNLNLNEVHRYQNNYISSKNKIRISPLTQSYYIIINQIDSLNYEIIVRGNQGQIGDTLIFNEIQQVEFFNDTTIAIIFINIFDGFQFVKYSIDIPGSLTQIEAYVFNDNPNYIIKKNTIQLLYLKDNIQFYIRKCVQANLYVYYFLTQQYDLIQTNEQFDTNVRLLVGEITFDLTKQKLIFFVKSKMSNDFYMETYISNISYSLNSFDTLSAKDDIFHDSKLHTNYKKDNNHFHAENIKSSYLLTKSSFNFIGIQLNHFDKSEKSILQFLDSKSQLYYNDGAKSLILQDVQKAPLNKIILFHKKDNNKWWMSEKLGLIIVAKLYNPLGDENYESLPPPYYQLVKFLFIDTLEEAYTSEQFTANTQVFWFEKQETLIVCFLYTINSYKIINNKLTLVDSYQVTSTLVHFEFFNPCYQSNLNPLIICAGYGVYNFLSREEVVLSISSVELNNELQLKENDMYINYHSNQVYSIEGKKVILLDYMMDFKQNKFLKDIPHQAIYINVSKCYVYLIQGGDIIYEFKASSSSSNFACWYFSDVQLIGYYENGVFYSYQLPLSLNGFPKQQLQTSINVSQQIYFNQNQIACGQYLLGSENKYFNDNDVYKNFMLLDVVTGEIKEILSYIGQYQYFFLVGIWPEKQIIITEQQVFSYSDIHISFNINGFPNDGAILKYLSTNRFNYLFYEHRNSIQVSYFDVSQLLPATKGNSLISSRHKVKPINFYSNIPLTQGATINYGELITFNWANQKLMKYSFYLNRKSESIQQQLKLSTIADISTILSYASSSLNNQQKLQLKTTYEIFKLGVKLQKNIYGININCLLTIITSEGIIMETIDLQPYQCKVIKVQQSYSQYGNDLIEEAVADEDQKIILINQYKIIYQIKYNQNVDKVELVKLYEETQQDYLIISYISIQTDSNNYYSCIIYSNPKNEMRMINAAGQSFIVNPIFSTQINNYQFLLYNNIAYLLIGTDMTFVSYSVTTASFTNQVLVETSNFLTERRGEVKQIKYFISDKVNIIITTTSRVILFQNKSPNMMDLGIIRENIFHTRYNHQLKILNNNQLVIILSQLQISIFSSHSLQYIGRIEELSTKSFLDVHAINSGIETILVVCEKDKLLIYNLSKQVSDQLLKVQKEFSQSIPIVYSLIHSSQLGDVQQNYIYISGANLNGSFTQKYMLSEDNCIREAQISSSLQQQENFYEDLILNDNTQFINGIQKIYIELDSNKDIFIPINLLNANQVITDKKFDIQINLMQYKGTLYSYSFNQTYGLVNSLKIYNGYLAIGGDIHLFNMDIVSIQNVQLSFTNSGKTLNMMKISKIILESLSLSSLQIKNGIRNTLIQNNEEIKYLPLITCKNSTDIIINNLKLNDAHLERDLIQFSNNENIGIKQIQITSSQILGSLLIFDNSNLNVDISQFTISNSKILQAFSVIIANTIKITKVQIINTQSIFDYTSLNSNARMLQDNSGDIQDYKSFIYIRAVSSSCIIQQISVKNKSVFFRFLDYSNYFEMNNIIYEIFESSFNFVNVIMDEAEFNSISFLIKETQILVKNIEIQRSINPTFSIKESIRGFRMQNSNVYNNQYKGQSQFIITNSLMNIEQLNCYDNTISIDESASLSSPQVYGIEITQSNYFINNLVMINNESPTYYIYINEVYQNDSTIPSDWLYQQYAINRLSATFNSHGVLHLQSQKKVTITKSIFNNNSKFEKTLNGGAIYLTSVEICKFIETEIQSNLAQLYGGGIFMENSDIQLQNCKISKNKALIGGGVRYINSDNKSKPFIFLSSNIPDQVYDNIANVYGKNYGSVPTKIDIQTSLNNWNSNQNQQSISLLFQILGEDGEIADFEHPSIDQSNLEEEYKQEIRKYSSFILSSPDKSTSIEKQTKEYIQNKQLFNITFFIVNTGYNELVAKSQNKEQSKSLPRRHLQIINQYFDFINKQFSVSFRDCKSGEIIQKLLVDSYQCLLCEGNTYSINDPYVNIGNQICNQCPIGGQYCQGNILVALNEYWIDEGSDSILYCNKNPNKCTMSFKAIEDGQKEEDYYKDLSSSNGCSEGGIGPMCESCDYHNKFWGAGGKVIYGKQSRYECYICGDKSNGFISIGLPLLLIFIFFVYILFQIFTCVKNQLIYLKMWVFRKIQVVYISSSLFHKDKSSTLLKILISYIQIVSVVSNFNLKIPEVLQQVFFFIGSILDISFYTLDCFFIQSGISEKIKMVYLRLIWTIISPILFGLVLVIVGYFLIKKWNLRRHKSNILKSGLLQLYYLIFPSLVKQTISTVCCSVINDKSYVLMDTQYECYDKEYFIYNFIFSLPFLIFTVYIPYFIFCELKKNKDNLSKIRIYLNYGFFFQEYKDSQYYWEIIKIYQKIFLQFAVSIFNQSNVIMGIIVSLSIIFYIVIQEKNQPYKLKFFNYIDQSSQFTAILSIYSIIINSESTSDVLSYIFLILVIAINSFFVIRILIYMSIFSNFKKIINPFLKCNTYSIKIVSKSVIQQLNSTNIVRVSKNWSTVFNYIEQSKLLRLSVSMSKLEKLNDTDKLQVKLSTSNQKENLMVKKKIPQTPLPEIEESLEVKQHRQTVTSYNFNEQILNEDIEIRIIDTKQAFHTITELQKF